MQRRATAAYIALFLVLAAGSYGFIATAQAPVESMDASEAAYTLQQGDTLTVNDRTYSVQQLKFNADKPNKKPTVTLSWENESAPYSEVWGPGDGRVSSFDNASVVETDGGYEISFPTAVTMNYTPPTGVNATNVSFNETAVTVTLSDNSTDTVTSPGEGPITGATVADNGSRVAVTYFEQSVRSYDVVIPSNDTVRLRQQLPEGTQTRDTDNGTVVRKTLDNGTVVEIPIEQYEPLERVNITTADSLTYRGNATTLSVGQEAATVRWNALRVNTVETKQATNVTLNGKQFFGYFTGQSEISLFENPDGYEAYQQEVEQTNYFNERINGFWGVVILSIVAAGFVAAVAFLPRKDT